MQNKYAQVHPNIEFGGSLPNPDTMPPKEPDSFKKQKHKNGIRESQKTA